MTREAELRASEQMRDRIADMLHGEGAKRDRRSAEQVRAGMPPPSRCGLLFAMEREVRRLPGQLAQKEVADGER